MARAMAVTTVPEIPPEIRVQDGEDEPQDPNPPDLTTRQRQGKLFKELDLSGLKLWPLELAEATCWLLAEYHDVFFIRTHGFGLYSLYWTYNQSDRQHSLQGTI